MCTVLCCVAACRGKGKAAPPPQEVAVATVALGSIDRKVLFTGNIVAKDAVAVYPRASGRVAEKLLKEGDPVKKGQAILTIDRDEIGYRFKPMAVDSPIDGLVGTIDVDVGAYVSDRSVSSQKSVATVVRPGTMRVRLDVPERYLEAIRPGTEVAIAVDPLGGATYAGTIVAASPVVSEKTRTANIEAEVQNADGRLRHGMFARMELVVERHDGALVVPSNAISWEGERQFVYRIADGKAHRVPVTTGLRGDIHAEILGGIAEGDLLAVGNLLDIEDGEAVTVKAPDLPSETRSE